MSTTEQTVSPRVMAAARNLHRVIDDAGATMRIVTDTSDVTIGWTNASTDVPATLERPQMPPVHPPAEEEFEGDDFLSAPDLDRLKNQLIVQWPEFGNLRHASIDILWKAKGGNSGGKLTFGKCSKMSGLAKHYSGETFVIWLAADHVREYQLSQRQIEALVYHELSHCGWEVDDKTGELKWHVAAHDATVFFGELERYGAWQQDLRTLQHGYAQLALTAGE
ncbi:MAG: putative metallopeptidase [Thermomicrobiales bacterium]